MTIVTEESRVRRFVGWLAAVISVVVVVSLMNTAPISACSCPPVLLEYLTLELDSVKVGDDSHSNQFNFTGMTVRLYPIMVEGTDLNWVARDSLDRRLIISYKRSQ